MNKIVCLIGFVVLFSSCGNDSNLPDLKGVSVDLELDRFEQDLQALSTQGSEEEIEAVKQKYPILFPLYFERLLPIHQADAETAFAESLQQFLSDERISKLMDTTSMVFKNFDPIQQQLEEACTYMKYYFPEKATPKFFTMITEFTHDVIIFDDVNRDGVGIGLDMFLGDPQLYKQVDPSNPSFSNYLTRAYNKDHLVKKVMEIIIDDMVGPPNGKRMIDQMVNKGIKLHILDQLMPTTHDSIVMEYTPEQLQWLDQNELEIYAYFLDRDLIYEVSNLKIGRYLNPAPTSTGMPDGAPGRTAVFIGKKIVDRYMKRFPKTTLKELMGMKDAQKLLTQSRYKPKRK